MKEADIHHVASLLHRRSRIDATLRDLERWQDKHIETRQGVICDVDASNFVRNAGGGHVSVSFTVPVAVIYSGLKVEYERISAELKRKGIEP